MEPNDRTWAINWPDCYSKRNSHSIFLLITHHHHRWWNSGCFVAKRVKRSAPWPTSAVSETCQSHTFGPLRKETSGFTLPAVRLRSRGEGNNCFRALLFWVRNRGRSENKTEHLHQEWWGYLGHGRFTTSESVERVSDCQNKSVVRGCWWALRHIYCFSAQLFITMKRSSTHFRVKKNQREENRELGAFRVICHSELSHSHLWLTLRMQHSV